MSSSTPATSHRKLSEAEWAEAKALYETGRQNKSQLAEKFGISRQSIHEGLTKRGAVYACRAKEVEEAAVDAEKDAAKRRLEEIAAMKDKQKSRVELIQNLAVKQIADQVRAGKPIADKKQDLQALRMAMAIVSVGRDELYHIFDLYNEPDGADEVPEFIVSEYTQDEIDALNRQRLGISVEEKFETVIATAEAHSDDPLAELETL